MPGLQVLDAVSNGTVECGHTYTGYYIGKNPSFIFDGSLPFGFTPRQHNAWMMFGDGRKLMDEVYDSFDVVALPAGQTGGQMFGWFRKEIKTPEGFRRPEDAHRGLRRQGHGRSWAPCRSRSPAARSIRRMERGTIDACEWVGPYDDEKLGFNKVAKYYYTPGVMELEAVNQLMVGKQPWASLPPRYQAALRYAGNYAMTEMLASYDAKNAQAIARLVASGTQLSVLPEDVIKALRGALETVLDEEAASNEQFKKILANWRQFRADQHRWFSIADTRAELAVYRTDPSASNPRGQAVPPEPRRNDHGPSRLLRSRPRLRSRRYQRASDRERPYANGRCRATCHRDATAHHPPAGRRGACMGEPRRGTARAHRGVGPKGYVRSDERIRMVCDDLMDDPWSTPRASRSRSRTARSLSGTVENRDAKRWAEDCRACRRREARAEQPASQADALRLDAGDLHHLAVELDLRHLDAPHLLGRARRDLRAALGLALDIGGLADDLHDRLAQRSS